MEYILDGFMFDFDAYFIDEKVYIGSKEYVANEILTACLELPADNLEELLRELEGLRRSVQLSESGDAAYQDSYDTHVQRAQELLSQVGSLALSLPPYNASPRHLKEPVLKAILNDLSYWKCDYDESDYNTPEFFDGEYRNGYGHSISAEDTGTDEASFYFEHFVPSERMLNGEDKEYPSIVRAINRDIRELFDGYLTFLEDMIRVRTAYTDLLDNYIHSKNYFRSAREIAEEYDRYTEASERKSSYRKVGATNPLQMAYAPFRAEGKQMRLAEAYRFSNLGDFLYIDFFRGVSRNYLPRRCDNCKQYFLIAAGRYNNYCERPLAEDEDKTCRDVGARRKYDDKCRDEPVWLAYNRAYKTHYARLAKKKMTKAQFEEWSRQAIQWRKDVQEEKLTQEEYERLLKK